VDSDFTLRLKRPLRLDDGRVLKTLEDAVALIGHLPEFPKLTPGWELACEALGRAAKTRHAIDIEFATCELALALASDDLSNLVSMF
jgi:hypothetical protein